MENNLPIEKKTIRENKIKINKYRYYNRFRDNFGKIMKDINFIVSLINGEKNLFFVSLTSVNHFTLISLTKFYIFFKFKNFNQFLKK